MVLEPAPIRSTEPQEPIITEANRADALLLWQEYQVKMEVYDRELTRYEKHWKRMKEMRSFIIDTIDMEHEPVINDIYDAVRMIQALEAKLAPKPN